nr:GMP synthase [Gammaproteobacteria bacterium]
MSDILILTHVDYCPPGHLSDFLTARRLDFRVLRADLGELDGYDLDRPRAVAVMGGPMSVNDPLPWLSTEVAALRHFIRRDIPLIGHCLGGQLIARALGARVQRMPYTEAGWQPLRRLPQAADDPWVAGLPEELVIYQWHSDTFDLPEGARHLLSSAWCRNQAFAWGERVLALQGHPEITESLLRAWLEGWSHLLDASQPSQQGVEQMLEALPEKVSALQRVAEHFWSRWLGLAGLA